MTIRHIPQTGRHRPLTRLPDPPKPPDAMQRLPHSARAYFRDPATTEYLPNLTEAKAQRDAEVQARQAAEERVHLLESQLRRLRSGS